MKARLDRWREIARSPGALRRRLAGAAPRVLVDLPIPALLPTWVGLLDEVLRSEHTVSCGAQGSDERCVDPARPIPFEGCLLPFVAVARQGLGKSSPPDVLTPNAAASLERYLLAQLSFLAGPVIGSEFYRFRFEAAPLSAFESIWCAGETTTDLYGDFVETMTRPDRLWVFYETYPVLARLLCQTVEQWVSSVSQLCRRFHEDFAALRSEFSWTLASPRGAISATEAGLSDPHTGGQTVIRCELTSGEATFYKPRPVEAELAFYRFVEWLAAEGAPIALKAVRTVDRETHGWVEAVEHLPCHSEDQVEAFYRRSGGLLAVLHVLAVTDVHCENLIAHRDVPVAVDLETMLCVEPDSPEASVPDEDPDLTPSGSEPSVLSTGLLPRWQEGIDGGRFDMSAMAADESQSDGLLVDVWHAVNTDQMRLVKQPGSISAMTHRVEADGIRPTVAEYRGAFVQGFRSMYRFIESKRESLRSDCKLLANFDGLELRRLLRNTSTYARLQHHLLHPEYLKDGLDRSIELERLARRAGEWMSDPCRRAQIYETEFRAMERFDIPYFSTTSLRKLGAAMNGHASSEGNSAPDRERDSTILLERLATLSESDIDRQVRVIELAIRRRFDDD